MQSLELLACAHGKKKRERTKGTQERKKERGREHWSTRGKKRTGDYMYILYISNTGRKFFFFFRLVNITTL